MDERLLPHDFFVEVDRSSPIPLYHQVAVLLESAVRDNRLPPGSRLESEISIGHRFGLSRPTVRRAIEELVDKGLLVRRRGIGTQVVRGQVTRDVELTSLFEDLQRAGKAPTTEVVEREVRPASAEIAAALDIAPGTPVLNLVRRRLADGTPIAVLDNTLPQEFGDLTDADLTEHGLYQLLRARGVTIRVAKQRISARAATARERSLLSLPRTSPVLALQRTAFDSSGLVIELGRHCYSPDLYSFEMTLVER